MSNLRFACVSVVCVVCALAVIGSCSKKNGAGGDEADDGNNPFFIGDVAVAAVTDSSALLVWTATGDDSDQGTATTYDIRYWHTWISPSNWDSSTRIVGEPHPKVAGAKESLLVNGLKKDSTYFFGLQVCDEANNCAGSNCAFGTCFTDVVVTFPDYHLDSAIRANFAKPTGDIMLSDLRAHDGLMANEAGISSLSGIEPWKNLRGAGFASNSITDLSPLSSLHNMLSLGLTDNGLSDISPLTPLQNLTLLHLRTNHVVDLSALTFMTSLRQLDLTQNQITDLAPLVANSGLGAGDTIWIGENPLSAEATTVQVPALQARGVAVMGL